MSYARSPRLLTDAFLTLPLGSTARVTNLETGRCAIVTIRDRGPYVRGRIVDLSPATARKIGIGQKQGIATVEVVPLQVPIVWAAGSPLTVSPLPGTGAAVTPPRID
jgi:rare lipoprotein A